jgi:membrane fusion protein (multidrug efflux system)
MKKPGMIILAVLLVVIVVIVGLKISRTSDTATTSRSMTPTVKISKPQRQLMTNELQYSGDVAAIQEADIFSKVSGTLEQIYVNIGIEVQKDQILAIIDSTELYQQALENSATYQNNLLSYNRAKQLMDKNLLSKEDLDNAETTMKISQANYELAKTRLNYARITAPFSGFITKRYVDPGALISADNTKLFTLMDIATVKVMINVLEKDSPTIPKITKAIIVADALPDRKFEGKIARYSQAIDLATRTMAVEIDIPNKELVLKPGMFVTVTLVHSENPNAITVPTAVIQKDAQGTYVLVVKDNIAIRTPVQTGIEQNNRIEIVSGLSGTEDIITTGQQLVRDGTQVKIQS